VTPVTERPDLSDLERALDTAIQHRCALARADAPTSELYAADAAIRDAELALIHARAEER